MISTQEEADSILNRLSNLPDEEKAERLFELTASMQIPGFRVKGRHPIMLCQNMITAGGYTTGLFQLDYLGRHGSGMYLDTMFRHDDLLFNVLLYMEKAQGIMARFGKENPVKFEILLQKEDI